MSISDKHPGMTYADLKDAAYRLRAFWDTNPGDRLGPNAALTAVAKVYGWENAHLAKAELDARLANTTPETFQGSLADRCAELLRIFETEREYYAQRIYEVGRENLPHGTIQEAWAAEDSEGEHTLETVEMELTNWLDVNPSRQASLQAAILLHAPFGEAELKEAAEIFYGRPSRQIARALINSALDMSEVIWENSPNELPQWDVNISCWLPGSLQVEIIGPDGESQIGEIEAEVEAFAMIQVTAATEDAALENAEERMHNENMSTLWNPRPDLGVRDARWVGSISDGNPNRYVERDTVEDHWKYDYDEAKHFKALDVAGPPDSLDDPDHGIS